MKPQNYLRSGFNLIVKLLVTIFLLYFIHNHVLGDKELIKAFHEFSNSKNELGYIFLICAMLLMPLNWFLESLKWYWVMNSFSKLNILKAVQSVLIGVSFGIFTPARLGEYAGRTLAVEQDRNMESLYATFLCSVSQNVINIILGILFFSSVAFQWQNNFNHNVFLVFNLFLVLVGLLLYFNIKKLALFLSRFRITKRFIGDIKNYKFENRTQFKLLIFSLFRYAIYLGQFILVLKFYDLNTGFGNYLHGISGIYLIQSTIPIPPVLDLFARVGIAVLLFDFGKMEPVNVILSSLTLWVINLILPSLIGLVLLMKINIAQSIGYEQK